MEFIYVQRDDKYTKEWCLFVFVFILVPISLCKLVIYKEGELATVQFSDIHIISRLYCLSVYFCR